MTSATGPIPVPVRRPLQGLGLATRIGIAAVAATSVLNGIIEIWGAVALQAIVDGHGSDADLERYDSLTLLSASGVVASVVAGILWAVWQYRAASNCPPGSLRRTPWWHVTSWIIPVVSLWFPYQNMTDLHAAAGLRPPRWFAGWWAAWLASSLLGGIAGQISLRADDLPALIIAAQLSVLAEVCLLVAAPFAWLLVARLTTGLGNNRRAGRVGTDMQLDIWSDIACPWCYIGVVRLERALAAFPHRDRVAVRLRSFQLDPGLPAAFAGTEADYLAARTGLPVERVRELFDHVGQAARSEGLTLDFDTLAVANSRRAHRLLQEAARQDTTGEMAWQLELGLFRAHFTDGLSIWDPDVLVDAAVAAGLPADEARTAIDSPERDADVVADLERAAELGITGVPFVVLGGKYGVSGAQPLEVFEAALAQIWDEVHPAE